MKLILHIGTEKTGSTTTQRWASRNREALSDQGILYSQVLGHKVHIKLHLWCLAPGRWDEGFNRIHAISKADVREFRARLPDQFAAEVSEARKCGRHTFLISDELCHSRLSSLEEVQRVGEFLKPHFDEIEILCSLRPQIDLAVSKASNAAKADVRITKAYFDRIEPGFSFYNYKTLVERWSAVFGTENVRLVPFRRTPDFTDVVVARLGIDATKLEPPVRSNEAIDVRVMALTNAMKAEPLEGRSVEPFAYIPRDLLHRFPCEQRLQPGLELARSVHARFEQDNSDLANGRTDLTKADLEPDWSRYEGPGNIDILERPCAFSQQLATLVQMFNEEVALAQAHNEVLEAERHLELDRRLLARRNMLEARRLLGLLKEAAGSSHRIGRLEARVDAIAKELENLPDPKNGHGAGTPRAGRRSGAIRRSRASERLSDEPEVT